MLIEFMNSVELPHNQTRVNSSGNSDWNTGSQEHTLGSQDGLLLVDIIR